MASRLRIARLDPSGYAPVVADAAPSPALHRRLDAVIRRHLPAVTASLLAAPAPTADGRFIEWYSDLAGQPVPLAHLPAAEQDKARALLEDRRRSLAELAERLAMSDDAEARALAEMLRQALAYPGDETVYVVDGQPVLAFWGHRPVDGKVQGVAPPPLAAAAAPPAVSATAAPGAGATAADAAAGSGAGSGVAASRAGLPRWLWPALGLALLGVVGAGLVHYGLVRWPPWGPDYAALLKAAAEEEAGLEKRRAALRAQLDDALGLCALDRSLAAARAEHERLTAVLAEAEDRVREELTLCPLRAALQAARDDGRALAGRTGALRDDLARALEACRRQAAAERKRAEDDRKRAEAALRKAEEERKRAEAAQRRAEAERKRAEEAARRPPEPPAAVPPPPAPPQEPPKQPPAKSDAKLPPCPGERPPEDAPDVAIVLDASGSMGLPASATASEIQRQLRNVGGIIGLGASILLGQTGGPSRLDEAKKGINSVVRSLPNDVDVGLTVLQRCPAADNLGFFSGSQRGQLYQRVGALRPMQGTPLAQGIIDAAGMVDGIKAPAVVVVISDGEDSCGGDPCAAARQVKAQKPQLTINVVDIIGNGASNCVAAATGGRVLKPEDGLAFEKTIRKAAQEALKPEHCR